MSSRIWKTLGIAGLLVICLLFASCANLLPSEEDVTLSVPSSSIVTVNGETTSSEIFHDKTIKRADGLYEVFGRRLTEGNDEVEHIRFLFMPDGTPIGDRKNNMSGQDSIYLFDSLLESYVAGMEDRVDRVEDDRIYYLDGGYADLELDGDRIIHETAYSADGARIIEFKFNGYGQLETLKQFDENESVILEVRTTYRTVTP